VVFIEDEARIGCDGFNPCARRSEEVLGGCRMTGMEMGGIVLGGWDVGMVKALILGWGCIFFRTVGWMGSVICLS
jgi:hypothetical protein